MSGDATQLQAVVICETFSRSDDDQFELGTLFITDNQSPSLTCIAGGCLTVLDLLLQNLKSNGVTEIFLCYARNKLHEAHLKDIKSKFETSCLSIELVHSVKYLSIGDIVRDLEGRGKIKDHFIVASFDVLSNCDLTSALEQHRKRYKKSKLNVLTAVFSQPLSSDNPVVTAATQKFNLGLEPLTNQIVWFDNHSSSSKMTIDLDILNAYSEMTLMTNIYDTGIWICSPEAAHLFVDNFDFQDMTQFVRGVLDNEEIMGQMLHAHFIESHEFVSRCLQSFSQMQMVSSMIIQRLTYPVVPDIIDKQITFQPIGSYFHQDSKFDWSNSKSFQSLLSKNSSISSDCSIKFSVIGENCKVGKNVKLTRCFICNDVTVDDNCSLENVFISNSCVIKSDSTINCGLGFLGQSCTIGPKANVKSTKVFVSLKKFENSVPCSESASMFGSEASGFFSDSKVKECKDRCSIDTYTYNEVSQLIRMLDNQGEGPGPLDSSGNFSDSDVDDVADDVAQMGVLDYHEVFVSEVQDSIERNVSEGLKNVEDLILEINASKFAYNASLTDVVQCVTESVLNLSNKPSEVERKVWFVTAQKNLNQFRKLMLHYFNSEASQLTAVLTIERMFNDSPELIPISPNLMLFLYQSDFISEEVFVKWSESEPYDDQEAEEFDKMATRVKCKEFIEFMLQDDEEEDDDDDDEDEDED